MNVFLRTQPIEWSIFPFVLFARQWRKKRNVWLSLSCFTPHSRCFAVFGERVGFRVVNVSVFFLSDEFKQWISCVAQPGSVTSPVPRPRLLFNGFESWRKNWWKEKWKSECAAWSSVFFFFDVDLPMLVKKKKLSLLIRVGRTRGGGGGDAREWKKNLRFEVDTFSCVCCFLVATFVKLVQQPKFV